MPPSIIQATTFAAGILIGVGSTAFISQQKRGNADAPPVVPALPSPSQKSAGPAVGVGRGPSGVNFEQGMGGTMAREVLKYGFPGPVPDILTRTAYVAAYDRRLRHPAWTAEHLTLASLSRSPSPAPSPIPSATVPAALPAPAPGQAVSWTIPTDKPIKGDRSRSTFMEDEDVPEMFRAQMKDYFRSGYDRGHMVPAADAKISQQAMDETFLLTNIAPQVGDGFNRHYWAFVEDFVRRLTGGFEDVYVFTIPLYLPKQYPDGKWRVTHEVIGSPPSISVPTHFAKVVLASRPPSFSPTPHPFDRKVGEVRDGPTVGRELSIGAFVLPNEVIPDEVPLVRFAVPVEAVEKASGLSLFSPDLKRNAKELCRETKCEVIIRRFDDARKGQSQNQVQGGNGDRSKGRR